MNVSQRLVILLVISLATGVVLAVIVQGSCLLLLRLNVETEEWIRGTGVALDVASAADAGKRDVSFPFRF